MPLNGHRGEISALAFCRNNSKLFSGSVDGKVIEWNLETGTEFMHVSFTYSVDSLAVSSDARLVAVGTSDGILHSRNWSNWPVREESFLSRSVYAKSLVISPTGHFLVSGGSYKVSSWNINTGKMVASANLNVRVLHVASDTSEPKVFLGCSSGNVYSWNILGRRISNLRGGRCGRVSGLGFESIADEIMVAYIDGCLRIWNASLPQEKSKEAELHAQGTKSMSLSADGTRVAELTSSGDAIIWDTSTGTQVAKYHVEGNVLSLGPDGQTIAMDCRVDGPGLLYGVSDQYEESAIRVWKARNPPRNGYLSFVVGSNVVVDLSFSPDGNTLLVLQNGITRRNVKIYCASRWGLAAHETIDAATAKIEGLVWPGLLSPAFKCDEQLDWTKLVDDMIAIQNSQVRFEEPTSHWKRISATSAGRKGAVRCGAFNLDKKVVMLKHVEGRTTIQNPDRKPVRFDRNPSLLPDPSGLRDPPDPPPLCVSSLPPSDQPDAAETWELSSKDAEQMLHSCGPKAHELWPFSRSHLRLWSP